jgi:hypothetical protein
MKLQELLDKYPKIFQQYEGNPGGINWTGVPEGWLPIVDKLCAVIQKHCDSPSSMENPEYVEGSSYDRDDSSTHRYIQIARPQVKCVQMKEKFAGLRFYVENADERVMGMISMAEHICANTCETCSTEEGLGFTKGWITVRCKKCAVEAGKEWISREERDSFLQDVWNKSKKFEEIKNQVKNFGKNA